MTPRAASFATAVVLALLLGVIWTRPVVTALPFADSWPLLIGLPFIYYLGRPWRRVAFLRPASLLLPIFGVLLIAGGIISQLVIAMALGWTLLLAAWVRTFFTTESSVPRLMLLALFAFPWIATDFSGLGWQFRLSAAQATDAVFSLLGFSIEREGTLINIQGVPISVEAACAGMNLLPALLLAGTALGLLYLGQTRRFWLYVPLLFPLAWLANTLRIMVISGVALTWGSEFASGLFHTWGGLLILVFMLTMALLLALCLGPQRRRRV